MKKTNSSKKPSIDSCDCSTKSVIGLYEMLAQAQPGLTDKDRTLSDQGGRNLSTSSRSDK